MPATLVKSKWSSGNLIFYKPGSGATTGITFGEDGTGLDIKFFGDTASAYMLWDQSADALVFAGNARLDLTSCTVYASNTDGGVIKAGTSSAPVTEDTADMKFVSFYFDNGATSGDKRGIYNRLYLTGAGGGGESFRSYTEIVGVAAGTAHGAHISLGTGESTTVGTVTGLGVAVRATLGLASGAVSGGTYAAIEPEIYSFGASTTTTMTELSFIRCTMGGDGTGVGVIDDKAYLLVLDGCTEGSGNMVVASATESNYASAARCKINGVEKWLMFASTSG